MAKKKLDPEVELRINKEYEEELTKLEEALKAFFKADVDTRWKNTKKNSMREN